MVLKMNKEILVIVNWYAGNINEFENSLVSVKELFDNIVVCNKSNNSININYPIFNGNNYNYLDEIKNYITKHKLEIKSIVFIDNIDNADDKDIAKCALDSINMENTIILGSNDNSSIKKNIINRIFNTLFNTNFKTVLPEIKAINISLFNNLLDSLKNDNNYMITALNENIPLEEKKINTVWKKRPNRVGKRPFKILPYLKSLFPYVIKSIIPYIISLILFMIIFNLRSSANDLEGIIFANTISEGVGIVLHIIINYQILYKYNLISRNLLFILKKILRIILSCCFIYILYNLLNINLLLSKIIVDITFMIIIALIFTSLSKKD